MNLSKAAEISADRLGFIAVQDIEIVLKTMIKISCGLGSQYINFAFASLGFSINLVTLFRLPTTFFVKK